MIDYRLLTFIDVCETLSLTQTAKRLNLTQPAVSQHIRHLETTFELKLIQYSGKKMSITEAGLALLEGVKQTDAILHETKQRMSETLTQKKTLTFGATLTIADYVMPDIITRYAACEPTVHLNFKVGNTKTLIEALRNGEIECAFIEGYFNSDAVEHYLLKQSEFILVSGTNSSIPNVMTFNELFLQRLFIRELGSGSRDIFEKLLANHNAHIQQFKHYDEIGSISLIKSLVKEGLGVTYIYKEAVLEELNRQELREIQVKNVNMKRDFHFVFMKSSLQREKYINFLAFIRKIYNV